MSFQDSAFIFFIALLLFGPKKLPELARQLGKLMGEFRRASNEFRMQLDDELRTAEQAEKQKKIAALEAATPVVAPADPAFEASTAEELAPHPHAGLSAPAPVVDATALAGDATDQASPVIVTPPASIPEHSIAPVAIATSGDLQLHPPATGLPVSRNGSVSQAFDTIPEAAPDRSSHLEHRPADAASQHAPEETAQHG